MQTETIGMLGVCASKLVFAELYVAVAVGLTCNNFLSIFGDYLKLGKSVWAGETWKEA